MRTPIEILEVDYSVSPGGINFFEVYDTQEEIPHRFTRECLAPSNIPKISSNLAHRPRND